MAVNFSPEKYGMTFCPICSGKGYSYKSQGEREVCGICRGFGLIKEDFGNEENQNQIMRMAIN